MYIVCDFCKEKVTVFVSNWNLIPDSGHNAEIKIGKFDELNIDPNTLFKIKPAPSSYRCRDCGFEKQYTTNEIKFN